ncbi:hypothetical protein D3C85_1001300 [compost metagenome]
MLKCFEDLFVVVEQCLVRTFIRSQGQRAGQPNRNCRGIGSRGGEADLATEVQGIGYALEQDAGLFVYGLLGFDVMDSFGDRRNPCAFKPSSQLLQNKVDSLAVGIKLVKQL